MVSQEWINRVGDNIVMVNNTVKMLYKGVASPGTDTTTMLWL